jgi:hypothetical protein
VPAVTVGQVVPLVKRKSRFGAPRVKTEMPPRVVPDGTVIVKVPIVPAALKIASPGVEVTWADNGDAITRRQTKILSRVER